MTKTFFNSSRNRVISSINMLLNIFRNKELYEFVTKEIRNLWDKLKSENSKGFFEFVKVFFRINPTKTFLIIKDKIYLTESIQFDVTNIDMKNNKNHTSIYDDIIKILSGFADMDELPLALDLLFEYYSKRPDLFMQFYSAINSYLIINKDSKSLGYFTQITLLQKSIKYSDNWTQKNIIIFFLEIAKTFLKLSFSSTGEERNHQYHWYEIPLGLSEGVKEYRKLIWESLLSLSKIEVYKDRVKDVLSEYNHQHPKEISASVIQYDFPYIQEIIETSYPSYELKNCIIVHEIKQLYKWMDIPWKRYFPKYFKEEKYKIFNLFTREKFPVDEQAMKKFTEKVDINTIKRIIDVCHELSTIENFNFWSTSCSLRVVFNTLMSNKSLFIEAITYYLENNISFNLDSIDIINKLFTFLNDTEIYNLIDKYDFKEKNSWLYAYYHELPDKYITSTSLEGLYDFLSYSIDYTKSPWRDVTFLERYKIVDECAFIKGCQVILTKLECSPLIVNFYFGSLFIQFHESPQILIDKFNNHLNLLEDIYVTMLNSDVHHDYDGVFLRTIYLAYPTILDRYIDYLIDKSRNNHYNQLNWNMWFLELDNYYDIFNKILDVLIQKNQSWSFNIISYLESVLSEQDTPNLLAKQDFIIRNYIKSFSNDKIKMQNLFFVIAKFSSERRISYTILFLEHNQNFEDFKVLPYTPFSQSWWGSEVPIHHQQIDFFKELLANPQFKDLKWLEHKNHIEEYIKSLHEQIKQTEIREILSE